MKSCFSNKFNLILVLLFCLFCASFVGVKEFEARWIGWAGVNVPDEVGKKALTAALAHKVT